jgi:hypothetical protein
MIVMAVAEHDGVRHSEVDAELGGVVLQRHALSGVEQDTMRAGVDPIGEAVFAEQAGAAHGIFREEGQSGHFFRRLWAHANNHKVFVGSTRRSCPRDRLPDFHPFVHVGPFLLSARLVTGSRRGLFGRVACSAGLLGAASTCCLRHHVLSICSLSVGAIAKPQRLVACGKAITRNSPQATANQGGFKPPKKP